MSSKGRTELQISLSRAKNVEEAAGDIRFCVFPQKTGENAEKLIFPLKKFVQKFFGVEKRHVGNRLKRVFPKFGGCTSHVRRVNGRSKFRKIFEIRESLVFVSYVLGLTVTCHSHPFAYCCL